MDHKKIPVIIYLNSVDLVLEMQHFSTTYKFYS
jgi:hypothetical protein